MAQLKLDPQPPQKHEETYKNVKLTKFVEDCRRFVKTMPLGTLSLSFIILFIFIAIFAPLLAPYDPVHQHRGAFLSPPSAKHLMGTDDLGRDVLSRIIYGSRISLIVGFVAVGMSTLFGTVLGVISGYFGGIIDMIIQRIMDAIMAIPALVLGLLIASLLGPSVQNVIIAIVIVSTPGSSRIVRGEMLRIREADFVEAARSIGASVFRIIVRHCLPNIVAPIIVLVSLGFGGAIVVEASLSFLGIGTPPPYPSWGLMLSGATRYMESAPWLVFFPGAVLALCVLAFNLLGDSVRDFLDPKL